MADSRKTEAQIALIEARAEAERAEARKANLEADLAQVKVGEYEGMRRLVEIKVAGVEQLEAERLASDYEHRVYRLLGPVTAASAKAAVETLVMWHRLDPACDITFVIDSPGGGIIEGLHLYDTILWLRNEGHEVTTITNGMAASMGGILLQAGSKRVAGPSASVLIHEASFGAAGSFGQVEDQVEFVKKLQDRLLDILAERSSLTKAQIKNRWTRKNWWLDAKEALKFGFIDEIAQRVTE